MNNNKYFNPYYDYRNWSDSNDPSLSSYINKPNFIDYITEEQDLISQIQSEKERVGSLRVNKNNEVIW